MCRTTDLFSPCLPSLHVFVLPRSWPPSEITLETKPKSHTRYTLYLTPIKRKPKGGAKPKSMSLLSFHLEVIAMAVRALGVLGRLLKCLCVCVRARTRYFPSGFYREDCGNRQKGRNQVMFILAQLFT